MSPPAGATIEVTYEALSFPFSIRCPEGSVAEAVEFVYGEMRTKRGAVEPRLRVEIATLAHASDGMEVSFDGKKMFEAGRLGDLLHALDNQLTFALENAAPSFYFVHGAALAENGSVTLIVGDSGAGKSTTSYALAASGMDYLSDELAPMDASAGLVSPYPRAICLKRDPPAPLRLPENHLRTEWTIHVRPQDLSSRIARDPLPLARIVFVRYSPEHRSAALRPLTRGEAALRLYQGALNQLAHPCFGLDDTLALIRRAECLDLLAAGIEETVGALGRKLPRA